MEQNSLSTSSTTPIFPNPFGARAVSRQKLRLSESISKFRPVPQKLQIDSKKTPSRLNFKDLKPQFEPDSHQSPSKYRKRRFESLESNSFLCSKARIKKKLSEKTLDKIKLRKFQLNKMAEEFVRGLQSSNGYFCAIDSFVRYKYYVAPGNNSELIVNIMKTRPKWKRIYTYTRANFVWSPWLSYGIIDLLPQYEMSKDKICAKIATMNPDMFPESLSYEIFPVDILTGKTVKIYNRLSGNFELSNKKSLFYNMQAYYLRNKIDPFTKIPLTFHIKAGSFDENFHSFFERFKENQKLDEENLWIVKPAENTNRGFGIRVCRTMEEIINCVNNKFEYHRTFIIQKYIENPLLYRGRKFDIRCYGLVTCFQNNVQGFFYKEGYIRTCTEKFNLNNVKNQFIHLTNDAIQKFSNAYGKFENANKLSYKNLQDYIVKHDPNFDFSNEILPQMKQIVKDTFVATFSKLNPSNSVQCFEVLGYDFMVDSDYKVWLIEVNTNPCLELVSPYLEVLIPKMLENAFALTIDQFFYGNSTVQNEFELVFSEAQHRSAAEV